jgi:hypothetical protein
MRIALHKAAQGKRIFVLQLIYSGGDRLHPHKIIRKLAHQTTRIGLFTEPAGVSTARVCSWTSQKLLCMVSAQQRAAPPKPRGGPMRWRGRRSEPVVKAPRPRPPPLIRLDAQMRSAFRA